MENEKHWRSEEEIRAGLMKIWNVMNTCIENGLNTRGVLPGTLNISRRAPVLYQRIQQMEKTKGDEDAMKKDPLQGFRDSHHDDYLYAFAIAVNEENANGGKVVSAPTNGAAGIIPAVIRYYTQFHRGASEDGICRMLLTAGCIGMLYKRCASISAAEVGCQGEVGVAASMSAAALTEVMGGTLDQVENAAEIGMEHSLGLTCDPIGGYVQIPCIERNAIGAAKAVASTRLALFGDGKHRVSLDSVIETMRQTGADMSHKYKETSLAGLAVNVTLC